MIRLLEDRVVNRIAAGEVVERPASVVKELVENALDAGAQTLRVALGGGGRSLIQVADDGAGMSRADATMCIERHATSKIRAFEDLSRVETLGFRGEALPSIAAVSRFELITRPHEGDTATRVFVEGGRLVDVRDAGAPAGTRVTARSLFFNVPARRKFLRTVQTELGHSIEAVIRQSLIRPDLDVEVVHNKKTCVRGPRVADRAARAADLLGPHGRALVPVAFSSGDLSVEALVSPVGVHRGSSAGSAYLYVNGRFVRDPVLRRAVSEAYRGIVPKGRYPTVVLEVRIPPQEVDVNVHPAKTEVRFRYARDVIRCVAEGLREALGRHGIKRPVHERGDPFPGRERRPLPQATLPLEPPAPPSPSLLATLSRSAEGVRDVPGPAYAATATPLGPDSLLPVGRFGELRVLGQLATTYVLCEGAGELVIIDQHAAHERITLDRLTRSAKDRLGGEQRLLTPIVVELTPARASALAPHTALLAQVGLEVEPFGGDSVAVKQLPEALANADVASLVRDVADALADGRGAQPVRDLVEGLLSTMACHTSVRAGQTLSPYEMRELLRALDQVDFSVCAHGRPVCIRLSAGELERRFHRS